MFPYAMLTVANCLAPPTDDAAASSHSPDAFDADTEAGVDGPRESNEESQGANAQNHSLSVKLFHTYMNNLFTKYQETRLLERPGRRISTSFSFTKSPNPYPMTNQSPLFHLKPTRPTDCIYKVDELMTKFLGWTGKESTNWWKTEQVSANNKISPYWRSPDGTVYRSERDCFRAKYQHDLPREEDLHEQLSSPTLSELDGFLDSQVGANGDGLGKGDIAALQEECGL
jgi:hypothetical protein